jgi:hypothetical protein
VRLAVVGSRGWTNTKLMFSKLDVYKHKFKDLSLVSGGAGGADTLAENWARLNDIAILVLPANWKKHGQSAGFIRNKEIWDNADAGIAFWDGVSRGTKHSFKIAEKQDKHLEIVTETY